MLVYHIILTLNTNIDNNLELLKDICVGISQRYDINCLNKALHTPQLLN